MTPAPEEGSVSEGLHVFDVHKSFGPHHVLRGVDLEVLAGSFTAILGPSGSGKTTLLRILAGFERPDRGGIVIHGRQVEGPGQHLAPEQRRIGYVPQEGALFPHLTVEGNVGFGLPRRHRHQQVADLLAMVGLTELRRRYPHELSGGQQQRVALARALAVRPEVVLLDEPFASLDAGLRASVRDEVRAILAGAGTTAVLVTHDQDEALSLADQVAVIRDGRIVQCGPPRRVYQAPVDAELARFVGEANIVPGTVREGLVETPLGALPVAHPDPHEERAEDGSAVEVLVRPEQITLVVDPAAPDGSEVSDGSEASDGSEVSDGSEASDGRAEPPVFTGEVTSSGYHGHDILVKVAVPGTDGSVLVRATGDLWVEPGTPVHMAVDGRVRVWPAPRDGLGKAARAPKDDGVVTTVSSAGD